MKNFSIKSWAIDDRPREKLLLKGKNSLSNAELIAILIGSGNRNESAVDLSKRILESVNNNLNALSKVSIEELIKFKGIGKAKAISIITGLELSNRIKLNEVPVNPTIKSSKDVFNLTQHILGNLQHEEFWVLFLNNSNKVISKNQISKGGITATVVDIRLLFKKAVQFTSVSIIICHNHPSGNLKPSNADINLTKKIKKAGDILDIKLLDHLIITEKDYFSFTDKGLL